MNLTAAQRAELAQLTGEYTELMYPGMEAINGLSDREADLQTHRARVLACRIVDQLISYGVLGGTR